MPMVEEEELEDPQEENDPGDDKERAAERAKAAATLAEIFRGTSTEKKLKSSGKIQIENFISSSNAVLEETSDTSDALGENIQILANRIDSIEDTLGLVTGSTTGVPDDFDETIKSQLDEALGPIRTDLNFIKDEVMPDFEAAQSSVRRVDKFLREYVEFLVASVEVQGKLNTLQGDFNSISARVTHLEDSLHKKWSRNFGYLTLVVAAIGTLIAAYAAFFKP